MSNAKFKFYGADESSNIKLMATENHPNLEASQDDLGKALNAVSGFYGLDADSVVLNSDTTVYTAA